MSRRPCLPNDLLDYQSLDVYIVLNTTSSDQSEMMWWAALPTRPCCRNLRRCDGNGIVMGHKIIVFNKEIREAFCYYYVP